jgi:hypothetical protein
MINNLGEVEQQLGHYDAALELFQAGRRLCAEIGQRLADAYLLCNMALSAFRRGDAAGSIESATAAMGLAEELKDGAARRPRPRARRARPVGRCGGVLPGVARTLSRARPRDHASGADRRARPNRPLAR